MKNVYGDHDAEVHASKRSHPSTATEGEPDHQPPRPRGEPTKLRGIQGLKGSRLNMMSIINDMSLQMSLARLLDVSPAMRQEVTKLLQTNKKDKGKKPAKRPRVIPRPAHVDMVQYQTILGASNAVQSHSDQSHSHSHSHSHSECERKNMDHNDAIVTERKATQLFYADADLFSMSTDDRIRGLKTTKALIDGGSTSNLIPQYLVEALQSRTIKLQGCSCGVPLLISILMHVLPNSLELAESFKAYLMIFEWRGKLTLI